MLDADASAKVAAILKRIAGPYNAHLYVGRNYSLEDLERDLYALAFVTPEEPAKPLNVPPGGGIFSVVINDPEEPDECPGCWLCKPDVLGKPS